MDSETPDAPNKLVVTAIARNKTSLFATVDNENIIEWRQSGRIHKIFDVNLDHEGIQPRGSGHKVGWMTATEKFLVCMGSSIIHIIDLTSYRCLKSICTLSDIISVRAWKGNVISSEFVKTVTYSGYLNLDYMVISRTLGSNVNTELKIGYKVHLEVWGDNLCLIGDGKVIVWDDWNHQVTCINISKSVGDVYLHTIVVKNRLYVFDMLYNITEIDSDGVVRTISSLYKDEGVLDFASLSEYKGKLACREIRGPGKNYMIWGILEGGRDQIKWPSTSIQYGYPVNYGGELFRHSIHSIECITDRNLEISNESRCSPIRWTPDTHRYFLGEEKKRFKAFFMTWRKSGVLSVLPMDTVCEILTQSVNNSKPFQIDHPTVRNNGNTHVALYGDFVFESSRDTYGVWTVLNLLKLKTDVAMWANANYYMEDVYNCRDPTLCEYTHVFLSMGTNDLFVKLKKLLKKHSVFYSWYFIWSFLSSFENEYESTVDNLLKLNKPIWISTIYYPNSLSRIEAFVMEKCVDYVNDIIRGIAQKKGVNVLDINAFVDPSQLAGRFGVGAKASFIIAKNILKEIRLKRENTEKGKVDIPGA